MKLITAALDLNVDDRPAGLSQLRVEAVGHSIDSLDGFEVGDERAPPNRPDVHIGGAIKIPGDSGIAGAVHNETLRALRAVPIEAGLPIIERIARKAWYEVK